MARIRTIKPEFFTSEDIVALQPFARLLYIALWCEADREGRLAWRPQTFKMRYLPADSVDIGALCQELTGRELVQLYGNGYAFIPGFASHQHVNPREAASKLPEPSFTRNDASSTRKARVSDTQVGREGKEGIEHASHASEILDHLNLKAGKAFKAVKSNLGLIAARLKEGATVDECKAVVDAKVVEWSSDAKMRAYLRPETLFNASKFAQYVGDLASAVPAGGEQWE
jgi:uncharacterized phage protein (TIGR02220 family)